MVDEENGDTNDEVEDKEDEALETLILVHANVVNLGLRFRWRRLNFELPFFRIWGGFGSVMGLAIAMYRILGVFWNKRYSFNEMVY